MRADAPHAAEEIRRSIEANRAELGIAVEKLRGEVAEVTDWRKQLRAHQQQVMIGAAVAGFVLGGGIAAITGLLTGRRRQRRASRPGRAWLRRAACGGVGTSAVRDLRGGRVAERAYSRIEIWIVAAAGIASSAPSTPNSVEPNSTAISTTIGCTSTVRAWMRGWMTVFSICW